MSELPMIGTVADVAKWLGWTESKSLFARPAGHFQAGNPAIPGIPQNLTHCSCGQCLNGLEQELEQGYRPSSATQPLRNRTAQYISRATTGCTWSCFSSDRRKNSSAYWRGIPSRSR